MADLGVWFWLGLIGAAAAAALFYIFRRRRRALLEEDHYTRGLELWLAGDRQGAIAAFRLAIEADPGAIDPYLQLGSLLRQTGDAKRAAVLHRTLTVRHDVPQAKRFSIALALAEDLIQMGAWEEARVVLDELESGGPTSPRFWRARFHQWAGLGNEGGAARALKDGSRRAELGARGRFLQEFELYQLDRALRAARNGRAGESRQLLKGVRAEGEAGAKVRFVRGLVAGQEGDLEQAIGLLTSGLVEHPEEMHLFLPALQQLLLASGHYERTIPILEAASQAEASPPALWIALCLLYEKLEERDKAIALLEEKAHDPRLTPDAAAPFLRLLVADAPASDFARVWRLLRMPGSATQWRCAACDARHPDVLWFCPSCRRFQTIVLSPR